MLNRWTPTLWSFPLLIFAAAAIGCNPTPTVTGINPASGPEQGGNTVTITGTNFKQGAQVDWGGQLLPATVVSKTEITVTAPAHAAGSVSVTVVNPNDKRAVETVSYTYVDSTPPTVQNMTPADGQTFVQGTDYQDAVATGLTTISVQFSEPLQSGTLSVTMASAPDALKKDAEGEVAGTVAVSGDTVTFTAEKEFLSARTYTFTVSGTDAAGNASQPQTATFTVATPKRVHWYTSKRGDTLQAIAARPDTYDNEAQWKKILTVNQDYHEIGARNLPGGIRLALHW